MCNVKNNHVDNDIDNIHNWLKSCNFHYYSYNSLPEWKIIKPIIGSKYGGIIWRQINKLSPINLRSTKHLYQNKWNPKATILLAKAYLNLWMVFGNIEHRDAFLLLFNRIKELKSTKSSNFTIKQNKVINVLTYSAVEDSISPLLTAFAGHLFIDAYKNFKESEYLSLVNEVTEYFLHDHPKIESINGTYYYYDYNTKSVIYNCSAVISSFLVRSGRLTDNVQILRAGEEGVKFIIDHQNEDGSWYYGKSSELKYIDGFHTAFILLALNDYSVNSGKQLKSLEKGLKYYKQNLFENENNYQISPIRYVKTDLPLNSNAFINYDLRDVALPLILFSKMDNQDLNAATLKRKLLNWSNDNMRSKDGNLFIPFKTKLWEVNIPYIDYQAWMFLALSCTMKRQ